MLKLMDQKVTHEQLADRFKCSERLVRDVKKNRKKYETEAAAGRGGSKKNVRTGNNPEVDAIALDLLEKARKTKMPVTRDVLRSFGRAARATLLADPAASTEVKARVEDFKAGERWARNFVKRNSIDSVRLHGEAGSVNKEAIKVEDMTAQLAGTRVSTGREEEDEEEDSGDDNTGLARRVPPAYGELSSHFGVLEAAAEESGNGDAALYLAKAKMAMIAAHSKRRVRQADMREFVATE
ncbi:unnamed protein product [Ectocarpus sp. CCAP 1310/34]|nr:unnamed protein product [Ectocarpus sp. CCAP 1310/34]